MTRRGIKARDFLDIFLVCGKFDISLSEIQENSIKKINHSTNWNRKYRVNLQAKLELLKSGELFRWGDEKNLLLRDVDEGKFIEFKNKLEDFLNESIIPHLNGQKI